MIRLQKSKDTQLLFLIANTFFSRLCWILSAMFINLGLHNQCVLNTV
jgi:hypothetical protein